MPRVRNKMHHTEPTRIVNKPIIVLKRGQYLNSPLKTPKLKPVTMSNRTTAKTEKILSPPRHCKKLVFEDDDDDDDVNNTNTDRSKGTNHPTIPANLSVKLIL